MLLYCCTSGVLYFCTFVERRAVPLLVAITTCAISNCFARPLLFFLCARFDWFVDIIFAIDLIVCFRTAYFLDDGRALVIVRETIGTHVGCTTAIVFSTNV